MRNIERRLTRLEIQKGEQYSDVLALIKKGKYYDELTEAERERYAQYYYSGNVTAKTIKTMHEMMGISLHFKLERKPKPPTPEEMEQRRREIEEYFVGCRLKKSAEN